jgi:hypothetical protein
MNRLISFAVGVFVLAGCAARSTPKAALSDDSRSTATTKPGDWGRIVWGKPVSGLRLGLCYWQTSGSKGGARAELHVDVYFQNVGTTPLNLLRPQHQLLPTDAAEESGVGLLWITPENQRLTNRA